MRATVDHTSSPPVLAALALAATLGAAPALAGHEGAVHMEVGAPAGAFDEHVDNLGFGFSLDYAYSGDGPLAVGIGGDFLIYGHQTVVMSLPLVEDFEYNTDNNIASIFLLARLHGGDGRVIPYVEGRFGGGYIWTETKLTDEDWYDDDEIARQTNWDDFMTIWGGGGGLKIMLKRGDPRDRESKDVLLDMKIVYRHGARASYLTEGAISVDVNDRVRIRPSSSETDLLQFELGVAVRF
ncbi:hypothetical protein KKG45_00490 [bacterium]|nr:hypothetical protein [bacterium]MBU1071702.1 hypothetical protein [bacterium]MBU1676480.1 hypothetical protein [bacterium]